MRIAILGIRGVPAAYGGFETFAEELGSRLVARGHDVTVYGRSHVIPRGLREHRGMRIRRLPTIRHKYLDTVAHTALSVIDVLPRRFDVVLICNNANAPFALVPRLTGARVVLNVDGLEWQRGKWGLAGRAYYRFCSWLSPRLPIVLVSDAKVIADWYRRHRRRRTVYIPYGSEARTLPPGETLARLGLEAGRYLLYVSRLEPENNAHVVVEAYRRAGGLETLGVPLVMVGDAPYATEYKQSLEAAAAGTPGVLLTGYVFGDGYVELQSNALAYVQATEVGGTHPALVEAMARGAAILANDVPEHREVLGEAGRYYARNDPDSLAAELRRIVDDDGAELGAAAAARAEGAYSWDHVTDEYEDLFRAIASRRLRHRRRAAAPAAEGARELPEVGHLSDVDIVCADLSANTVGRGLVFADILAGDHRVRLVGPASGELWAPLEGRSDLEVVRTGPTGWRSIVRTAKAISAPVSIALKPLLPSLGATLLAHRRTRVIADIDDPELELLTTDFRALVKTAAGPRGLLPTLVAARLIGRADAVTVAGEELARRHGGVIVPHVRDEARFAADGFRDRRRARRELDLPLGMPIAVFVGTTRRHKGVDLLDAVARAIPEGRVYVVGARDPFQVPAGVHAVPPLPYDRAMRWLAAADVVLVPQRGTAIAAYQVPAKLSDALAMGRAIVASDLPPVRRVVGEAAVLVPPDRADLLAAAVRRVVADPDLRARLERAARKRFLETLTASSFRPRVEALLGSASAGAAVPATPKGIA